MRSLVIPEIPLNYVNMISRCAICDAQSVGGGLRIDAA